MALWPIAVWTKTQPRSTFYLISSTGRTGIMTVSSLLWAWGMRVDDDDDDDEEGKDGKAQTVVVRKSSLLCKR